MKAPNYRQIDSCLSCKHSVNWNRGGFGNCKIYPKKRENWYGKNKTVEPYMICDSYEEKK